jgi:hypothetical protein
VLGLQEREEAAEPGEAFFLTRSRRCKAGGEACLPIGFCGNLWLLHCAICKKIDSLCALDFVLALLDLVFCGLDLMSGGTDA